MKKNAIVLLNMGGPNNLKEVEVFLKNMFADKNILTIQNDFLRKFVAKMIVRSRLKDAKEVYKRLGGKSPIIEHTKKAVAKLQQRVKEGVVVDFSMRYTSPFADETIQRLCCEDIDKIFLIPLYPQYSTTTTKSSLEDFKRAYAQAEQKAKIVETTSFFRNRTYNEAILKNIQEAMQGALYNEFTIIFSAHGLPKIIIDRGDVYEKEIAEHVAILKDMMQKKRMDFCAVELAYQSKVGPIEWLKPSLEEKLASLKGEKVLIFPISFTMDNSETDFELDIEYREVAKKTGILEYRVAKCLNDSDLFISALEEIYKEMQ